jgi:hypothetical protein
MTHVIFTDTDTYDIDDVKCLDFVPMETLLAVYNKLTGRNPTKFASRTKGQEQVFKALSGTFSVDLRTVVEVEPEPEVEDDDKKGRPRVNRAGLITVLVPNPKRPESSAFHLFALYKTGMTVGDFLNLGGTLATLRWDKARKYISVEE